LPVALKIENFKNFRLFAENGCVAADVIADDGWIYDTDRTMFLGACLTQL
jgi:hypothetical protein